ncbi:lipoprotein-34 [Halomonas cerina]|uniref:Outer membrane protein assembly factor BamC n=1 Tax=Halomonas cerina TaxID=447424 RepID=A0A839VDR6_9GAMM|nr:outer membrane protein assembly factor BamC [Halomonas cerina]
MSAALKWMPLTAVIALALAGCAREGYYDDRQADYVEAEESAPLVLPDARESRRYRDAMPVPEAAVPLQTRGDAFEAPRPQPLSAARGLEAGAVERREIGEQRWLVVGAEPAAVWPELERFARLRGLEVVNRDSARGVLETDQVRLVVHPGLRPGVSEVRCEQGGRPVSRCLQALSRHLASRHVAASASSLATQPVGDYPRPRLMQQGGEWQVMVPVDIDRTWAELSHQLAADFSVAGRRELIERDAKAHTFLVDYMTLSERSTGLLGTLVSLGQESPQRIRVVLEARGPERTVLRVRPADTDELSAEDRRELLERMASLLR